MMPDQINGLVLLADGNFTPPSRTPWGGTKLRRLKRLGDGPIVGESWEISIEPDFPGKTNEGQLLSEVAGSTPLLVKLLDAAEPLSVQIHPADDYVGLAPDESGKPESWYVIDRDPGAGLYVGLAPGAERSAMERAIDGGAVDRLLFFTEVEPGDFFTIEAGTPHCIGAGVTLVEPQHVAPGRRGVTYRYWDWNRRYNAGGRLDPHGAPRALHRDHALAVTDWGAPRADAWLEKYRVRAGAPELERPAAMRELAATRWLTTARLAGEGSLRLDPWPSLRGVTVIEGSIRCGSIEITRGRSAVILPHTPVTLELARAHALLCAVTR
jgi:mannose-6-phosphate isomerase class I